MTDSKKTDAGQADKLVVWLCTDMEGLAGVDDWDQCYDPDDLSPKYMHGCAQLVADVNATVAGCFDAGAAEVRVIDGHGRNGNRVLAGGGLDPRARLVWIEKQSPIRFEALDDSVHAVACVGQHSMAGTLNGFIDHTQSPKQICRFMINGEEHGELSQLAAYAGHYGIPLVYASGDEALCAEVRRLFPWVVSTATKRGTGWSTCQLYPVKEVREGIRRDIAQSLRSLPEMSPWRISLPAEITVEWAWSGPADEMARHAGVKRINARTVSWKIHDARDVYHFPRG